jgi:hypothetical protein
MYRGPEMNMRCSRAQFLKRFDTCDVEMGDASPAGTDSCKSNPRLNSGPQRAVSPPSRNIGERR